MSERVCVIANPAAGRGRGARLLPRVREAFAAVGVRDVRVTSAPGEERVLARRAAEEGFTTLVAVGGDGTWGGVANGILASGADVRLGLIGAGTGCDFAKTAGAPASDPAATARLAVEGPDRRVDVGRVEDRFFLNISGFGFDTAVLEDVERIRWLRGDLLYTVSALRQLFGYPGLEIGISANGRAPERRRHLMLIVANARHFGGKFRIAPGASLDDGKLDAIAIGDAPAMRRLRLFGHAGRGTHVDAPEVAVTQAPSFTLEFDRPPAYETDGEYNRARSSTLEVACVPGALRVVVPEGAA